MLDEYERFQGVVLRQIVASANAPVSLNTFRDEGRVSAFVISNSVGLYIKHSAKRMSPWRYTFHPDQASEFEMLARLHPSTFAVFVCGIDGIVTLKDSELRQIVGLSLDDQAWVSIRRRKRAMYSISGSQGELPYKLSSGVDPIIAALDANLVQAQQHD